MHVCTPPPHPERLFTPVTPLAFIHPFILHFILQPQLTSHALWDCIYKKGTDPYILNRLRRNEFIGDIKAQSGQSLGDLSLGKLRRAIQR